MNMLGPLAFALIAAIGNAIFATGQKKALPLDNPFTFIALSVIICAFITVSFAALIGQPNYTDAIKQNGYWAVLSGVGLFCTYLGFSLLYSRYGASNYILYAVLSIITTSVIVGVVVLKETFNVYHWLALLTSIVTIVLFTVGNAMAKA